jgi:molybdenum cofactor guanylyltransferase
MIGRIPAVILAGGRSTRMGGGDKVMKTLAGKPLLAHVIERLRPQAGPIALNANGDPARFESFGLPVIGDTVGGFAGPLAGILAGMEWASQTTGSGHLLSVAGDTPFFPSDLTERLSNAAATDQKLVLARSSGRAHPVFGLWPLDLRGDLLRFLTDAKTFKVMAFAEASGYLLADFPMAEAGCREVDPFFNVNTVDELATAESICREWS